MSGRLHQLAVEFLGRCECPCHRRPVGGADVVLACWCRSVGGEWPYRVAHNDAVRWFGRCPSRLHGFGAPCSGRTEQRWAEVFARAEERDRDRRVMRGQIRSSADVRRAVQLGVLRPGERGGR